MKNTNLIAPCGMNCALCIAFQREKNKCPGCNYPDKYKSKSCINCHIKNCAKSSQKSGFCYSCKDMPCKRLKQLDTRYKTKYNMSMIENLQTIKSQGIDKFLLLQNEKWTCKNCGSLLCVHRENCQNCHEKYNLNN